MIGRARVFGDDVNTDYIISSSRKRKTIDPSQLVPYLLEGVSPGFAASVQPGDVIVAGRNLGCGSAMEVAVTVIQAAGIRAVVARSFARSFYRNAINNGLLVIECDTSSFQEGDSVSIDVGDASVRVDNVTRAVRVAAVPLPPFIQKLIAAGGLVRHIMSGSLEDGMSVENTRETLTRYLKSDHSDLSMMAPDVVFTSMATGDEHRGVEALAGMLNYIYHVAFDAHAETKSLICTENQAVLEGDFVGKHIGEFAGVPATGKTVRVPLCVVYDLEGGKIKRGRVYFEVPAFLKQVGRT